MASSLLYTSGLKIDFVSFPSVLTGDFDDDVTVSFNSIYIRFPPLRGLSQFYITPLSHESYYKDMKYTTKGIVEFRILAASDEYRHTLTNLKLGSKILGLFVRLTYKDLEDNQKDTVLWHTFDTVIEGIGDLRIRTDNKATGPELSVYMYMSNIIGLYLSII